MKNTPTKYTNPCHCARVIDHIDRSQVVQKIGLCICMYDLLKVSDGLIGHGDGFVNVNGTRVPRPLGDLFGGLMRR